MKNPTDEKYDLLLKLFYTHDPIKLCIPYPENLKHYNAPADEYSPEVKAILPKLVEPKTEIQVFDILNEIITQYFGKEYVEPAKDVIKNLARDITNLYYERNIW